MSNPYAEQARQAKVDALVAVLQSKYAKADTIRYMDNTGWEVLCQVASVKPASVETRRLVIEKLEEAENAG